MEELNDNQVRGNNDEVVRGNNDHLHHASDLKEVNDLNYKSSFRNKKKAGLFETKSDELLLDSYRKSTSVTTATTVATTATTAVATTAAVAAAVVTGTVVLAGVLSPTVELKGDIDTTTEVFNYEINISNVEDFSDGSYTYDIKYDTDAAAGTYVDMVTKTVVTAANTKGNVALATYPDCNIYLSVYNKEEKVSDKKFTFKRAVVPPAPTPEYTLTLVQVANTSNVNYTIDIKNVSDYSGYTFSIVEASQSSNAQTFIVDQRVTQASTSGTLDLANLGHSANVEISLSLNGTIVSTFTLAYEPPYVAPTYNIDHSQSGTELSFTLTLNNVSDLTGYTYKLILDSLIPLTLKSGDINSNPFYGTFDFIQYFFNVDVKLEIYLDGNVVASESFTYVYEHHDATITNKNYIINYTWDIGGHTDLNSYKKRLIFKALTGSQTTILDAPLGSATGNDSYIIPLADRGTSGQYIFEIVDGGTSKVQKTLAYDGIWFDSYMYQNQGNYNTITFTIDAYYVNDYSSYKVNLFGKKANGDRIEFVGYTKIDLVSGFDVDVDVTNYANDLDKVCLEVLDEEDAINYSSSIDFVKYPSTSVTGRQDKETLIWHISINNDDVSNYTYTIFSYEATPTGSDWIAVNNYSAVAVASDSADVVYCPLVLDDVKYKLELSKNGEVVNSKTIDFNNPQDDITGTIEQIEGTLSVQIHAELTNISQFAHYRVEVYSDPQPGDANETLYFFESFTSDKYDKVLNLEDDITSLREVKLRVIHTDSLGNEIPVRDLASCDFYPDKASITNLMRSYSGNNAVQFDVQLLNMSEPRPGQYRCEVIRDINGYTELDEMFSSNPTNFTVVALFDGEDYTIRVRDITTGKLISGEYKFTFDQNMR